MDLKRKAKQSKAKQRGFPLEQQTPGVLKLSQVFQSLSEPVSTKQLTALNLQERYKEPNEI